MKFESSHMFFHEIIKYVKLFLAQQITTNSALRCFEKLGSEVKM